MENYSIFTDFQHYIEENKELIDYLEEHESLLDEFVSPIIKALNYLNKLQKKNNQGLAEDDQAIFSYGFDYLFENIEQIKLYIHQFHGSFELLEKKSPYIKIIFQLEELKVELEKMEEEPKVKSSLTLIQDLLDYFEGVIDSEELPMDLESKIISYYELLNEYNDVLMIADAFNEYCATYGI